MNYNVEVAHKNPDTVVVQTSITENNGSVEVVRTSSPSVIISTVSPTIKVSDLPSIPLSKLIGLDDYLDSYEFDCGTP